MHACIGRKFFAKIHVAAGTLISLKKNTPKGKTLMDKPHCFKKAFCSLQTPFFPYKAKILFTDAKITLVLHGDQINFCFTFPCSTGTKQGTILYITAFLKWYFKMLALF